MTGHTARKYLRSHLNPGPLDSSPVSLSTDTSSYVYLGGPHIFFCFSLSLFFDMCHANHGDQIPESKIFLKPFNDFSEQALVTISVS